MTNKTIYIHAFYLGAYCGRVAAVKDSAEVNAVENLSSPPQTTLVYLHIF